MKEEADYINLIAEVMGKNVTLATSPPTASGFQNLDLEKIRIAMNGMPLIPPTLDSEEKTKQHMVAEMTRIFGDRVRALFVWIDSEEILDYTPSIATVILLMVNLRRRAENITHIENARNSASLLMLPYADTFMLKGKSIGFNTRMKQFSPERKEEFAQIYRKSFEEPGFCDPMKEAITQGRECIFTAEELKEGTKIDGIYPSVEIMRAQRRKQLGLEGIPILLNDHHFGRATDLLAELSQLKGYAEVEETIVQDSETIAKMSEKEISQQDRFVLQQQWVNRIKTLLKANNIAAALQWQALIEEWQLQRKESPRRAFRALSEVVKSRWEGTHESIEMPNEIWPPSYLELNQNEGPELFSLLEEFPEEHLAPLVHYILQIRKKIANEKKDKARRRLEDVGRRFEKLIQGLGEKEKTIAELRLFAGQITTAREWDKDFSLEFAEEAVDQFVQICKKLEGHKEAREQEMDLLEAIQNFFGRVFENLQKRGLHTKIHQGA